MLGELTESFWDPRNFYMPEKIPGHAWEGPGAREWHVTGTWPGDIRSWVFVLGSWVLAWVLGPCVALAWVLGIFAWAPITLEPQNP